jgi:hypothetical protein
MQHDGSSCCSYCKLQRRALIRLSAKMQQAIAAPTELWCCFTLVLTKRHGIVALSCFHSYYHHYQLRITFCKIIIATFSEASCHTNIYTCSQTKLTLYHYCCCLYTYYTTAAAASLHELYKRCGFCADFLAIHGALAGMCQIILQSLQLIRLVCLCPISLPLRKMCLYAYLHNVYTVQCNTASSVMVAINSCSYRVCEKRNICSRPSS